MNLDVSWNLFCEDYREVLEANRLRLEAFIDLKDNLASRGVSILPLKGMDFLIRAYPSLGARPMADIDLLINKKDIPLIRDYFESRGFKRVPDEGLTYLSKETGLNFDLIWDIWYLPVPDQEAIWSRKVTREFEGGTFECLHPEDAFLYDVLYVTAHRGVFSPLFVQDLNSFLAKEAEHLDWDALKFKIKRWGVAVPLFYGLSYALERGLEGLPGDWLNSFKPKTLGQSIELFLYSHWVGEMAQPKVSYLFTWLGYPKLRGKLKLLREKLAPSRFEYQIHFGQSGSWNYFVHLFLHPFALVFRNFVFGLRDLAKLWRKPKTKLDAKNT